MVKTTELFRQSLEKLFKEPVTLEYGACNKGLFLSFGETLLVSMNFAKDIADQPLALVRTISTVEDVIKRDLSKYPEVTLDGFLDAIAFFQEGALIELSIEGDCGIVDKYSYTVLEKSEVPLVTLETMDVVENPYLEMYCNTIRWLLIKEFYQIYKVCECENPHSFFYLRHTGKDQIREVLCVACKKNVLIG